MEMRCPFCGKGSHGAPKNHGTFGTVTCEHCSKGFIVPLDIHSKDHKTLVTALHQDLCIAELMDGPPDDTQGDLT